MNHTFQALGEMARMVGSPRGWEVMADDGISVLRDDLADNVYVRFRRVAGAEYIVKVELSVFNLRRLGPATLAEVWADAIVSALDRAEQSIAGKTNFYDTVRREREAYERVYHGRWHKESDVPKKKAPETKKESEALPPEWGEVCL